MASDQELWESIEAPSATSFASAPSDEDLWNSIPEPVKPSGSAAMAAATSAAGEPGMFDNLSIKNVIPNLTSADWWLSRSSGEKITPTQAVVGPLSMGLNGLTAGQGDEIIAGGTSALDAITGNPASYEDRLKQVRGIKQNLRDEAPLTSTAIEIGTGLKMPLFTSVKASDGILKTGAKMAAEGGAISGLYGFNEGEGGFENRLSNAEESAKFGAALGGGLGVVGKTIPKIAGALSNSSDELARKSDLKAFGASQSRISKAYKDSPEILDEFGYAENPLSEALVSFKNAGGGKGSMEGKVLLKELETQKAALGGELESRIAEATARQTDVIIPEFTNTKKYLETISSGIKDEKVAEAAKIISNIENGIDGTLASLQREKVALNPLISQYSKGTTAEPTKAEIYKYIRSDLNRTISEGYGKVMGETPEMASKFSQELAELNKEYGLRTGLDPMFKYLRDSGESRTILGSGLQSLRTSGGLGQTLIAGTAAGGTLGGAAVLPAIAGNMYLQSPQGKRALANGLRRFSSAAGATKTASEILGKIPSSSAGILAGSIKARENQSQGDTDKNLRDLFSPVPLRQSGATNTQGTLNNKTSFLNSTTQSGPSQSAINSLFSEDNQEDTVPVSRDNSDLEPLVKQVIQQESGGNPDAVSDKDAVGLMQVLPSTAAEIAQDLGLKDYDLKDPETNIAIGSEYLKRLLQQFDGDVELALTAYHSGPGRVQRLLKETGGSTLQDILPKLGPVGQKYARQVLARKV